MEVNDIIIERGRGGHGIAEGSGWPVPVCVCVCVCMCVYVTERGPGGHRIAERGGWAVCIHRLCRPHGKHLYILTCINLHTRTHTYAHTMCAYIVSADLAVSIYTYIHV